MGRLKTLPLPGLLVLLTIAAAATYSGKHKNSTSVFEPRGDVSSGGYSSGGGGHSSFGASGGSSYGAPAAGGYDSYSSGIGGGSGGGYGAPAQATAFKYQIYPAMMGGGGGWGMSSGKGGGGGGGWGMSSGGGGWGEEEDDDGGLDKELIGLLGLKGLKGLKGLLGLLPFLKGLLLLKKLGLIPLLPILLPLLLPLFLLKAAALLLPLLLLLLIPIPVITTGRRMMENALGGRSVSQAINETLDELLPKLPSDLSHIIKKIRDPQGPLKKEDEPLASNSSRSAKFGKQKIKFIKPSPAIVENKKN